MFGAVIGDIVGSVYERHNMFNKKIKTRVIFYPNTGSIVKIDKEN